MRVKMSHNCPQSAFDNYETYEHVTGWEPSAFAEDDDIFKQLKLNLNKYERKYNKSKEREPRTASVEIGLYQRTTSNKENYVRLPSLNSVALRHVLSNREPLTINNHNILEDAMQRCLQNRVKPHKVQRLIKIKKVKCSQPIKPISPNFKLDFQKNTQPLKYQQSEHPQSQKRRRQEFLSKRLVDQLIEYDFSDAKFLPQAMPKPSGKQNQ